MGSALSDTCCFSTVSTTMRADPHLRYRSDSNKKKKRMNLSPLVCARFKGLIPSEIDQDLTPPRIGNEGSGAIARGRSAQASAGEAGERKDRGGRLADGWRPRREMRSTANVSQTLRGTEWKSLLKRLPKARRIYHAGKKLNEFAALTLVRCPVVNPNADYMQGLTPLALATWKESRLEYDRRGIVGSSLSNTCCFSE